jgi:hypothetical protein
MYLKQPTHEYMKHQLQINATWGWPKIFAFLDCKHYCWNKCSIGWQGQFTHKDKHYSIMLKVVVDQRLCIWHCHFDFPRGNNDINVLEGSPLISNML